MIFYQDNNFTHCGAFWWDRSTTRPGLWWVSGFDAFVNSGYAVQDDFGNLVRVP